MHHQILRLISCQKALSKPLLKSESKESLIKILTYNVVAGNLKASDVLAAIKVGKGKAVIKTIQGENLTARLVKAKVILTDAIFGKVTVTAADLTANNGVIHVINAVLMTELYLINLKETVLNKEQSFFFNFS